MKKQLDIPTRQKFDEVIEANLNYLVRFAAVRVGSKVSYIILEQAIDASTLDTFFKVKYWD